MVGGGGWRYRVRMGRGVHRRELVPRYGLVVWGLGRAVGRVPGTLIQISPEAPQMPPVSKLLLGTLGTLMVSGRYLTWEPRPPSGVGEPLAEDARERRRARAGVTGRTLPRTDFHIPHSTYR